MNTNLAIVGASYLQLPLIEKAKELGYTTHVFAWESGDVGETAADFFYPISIVEKEKILDKCKEIDICGICSIASDLATITVNFVAEELGLCGNSMETTLKSTNKHLMRKAFELNGDPSPKSILVDESTMLDSLQLTYPIIVKPTDRSGSRGIYKLTDSSGLKAAVRDAMSQGFEKKALVEEYAQGQEYSVEFVSYQGKHYFLALTEKFTTGAPHFIETGHLEPAPVDNETLERIKCVVSHALDSLEIKNGASHSELKVAEDGTIRIVEIGGRMGGDFIGSNLVELSTGIDFVKSVIDIAVGKAPELESKQKSAVAAVRFIFGEQDVKVLEQLMEEHPEYLVQKDVKDIHEGEVTDSSNRFGFFMMCAETIEEIMPYMPK